MLELNYSFDNVYHMVVPLRTINLIQKKIKNKKNMLEISRVPYKARSIIMQDGPCRSTGRAFPCLNLKGLDGRAGPLNIVGDFINLLNIHKYIYFELYFILLYSD